MCNRCRKSSIRFSHVNLFHLNQDKSIRTKIAIQTSGLVSLDFQVYLFCKAFKTNTRTINTCYMSGVYVDWANLLTQATGLHVLSLKANSLVGKLPNQIAMFKNLKFLDLSQNYFSDVIPTNIYDMVNLEHLYLNGNMLTGIIPWGVGQLQSLLSLDLSSNFMVGPLPEMRVMNKLQSCSVPSNICVVKYEDVPSICTNNLQLCTAVGKKF